MTLTKYYIVNMALVNIESYSDILKTPGRATVFGVDYSLTLFSPITVMNLLTNGTLNLQQQLNKPEITSYEKTLMSGFDSQIYLLRTNLRINNIDVRRDILKDGLREGNFVKCVYLQHRLVTFTNMSFNTTGFLLYSIDPMSFFVENVQIDNHANMGGFVMRISCNYPEAYLNGTVYVNNLFAENTKDYVVPIREAIVSTSASTHTIVSK